MPEGVELKLSADYLSNKIKNKYIIGANTFQSGRYKNKNPEGLDNFINALNKNKALIKDINVKGKLMYWSFDNGWNILCTYGMSAQWSDQKTKHTAFSITYLDDNNQAKELYFNDIRHFGTIRFINSFNELNKKLNSLGWDPLSAPIVPKHFIDKKINNNNKCIGTLLMDQSIFCGVGNYIRAEALYRANISPWRIGHTLSVSERDNLCNQIIKVMQESYNAQGATIASYYNVDGNSGKYTDFFKVYGKNKDPEGNIVVRETTPEGRTIHWVPAIQK